MIRNLFLSVCALLTAFAIEARAQSLKIRKHTTETIIPAYAEGRVKTSLPLNDGEYWDGYWNGELTSKTMGIGLYQVPMNYDVAMCFPKGTAKFISKTIEGARFTFPSSEHIENVKVWISTSLPATAESADILCQSVADPKGLQGPDEIMNEIRFDNPYKVDGSTDLYIGYSFDVTDGSSNDEYLPVYIDTSVQLPGGFFLRFDRDNTAWEDYSEIGFGLLAMQVLLSGEQYTDAAALNSSLGSFTGMPSDDFVLPLEIVNMGDNDITEISVSVELDGQKKIIDITPEQPIQGRGTTYAHSLSMQAPSAPGSYDIVMNVEKVNGIVNPLDAAIKAKVYAVSQTAAKKVFAEEFTGLWCGCCPRGTVALERIKQTYDDKVLCVSVHAIDEIACDDYQNQSVTVSAYPMAHIDRKYMNVDPYFGLNEKQLFGVSELIDEQLQQITAASVKASATINGDVLTATSVTTFMFSGDASGFALGYLLTEDGMSNEEWGQVNNYSGIEDEMLAGEPLFDKWIDAESYIMGIECNDVAIAAQGIKIGLENSVPQQVKDGEKYSHSVDFNLTNYPLIQNRSKLNMAVVLFDTSTGRVVNADMFPMYLDAAVEGIEADDENISETARYTAEGCRISAPQKGINIIKYSDGTVKKINLR